MEGPIDPAFHILRVQRLPSTNAWAMEQLGELDNLSVIRADCQTEGRGQRGNRWLSAPGENLTFSLVLRPSDLPAREQMQITALASVSLRETLLSQGIPAQIKWPNDIYVEGKKLAGMLIENRLELTRIAASVIGIGLNVNQEAFDPSLPNPISMRLLSGASFDCDTLLEAFLKRIAAWLPRLGSDALWEAYTRDLWGLGELRRWTDLKSGETFSGTISGVWRDGLLEVTLCDSSVRSFAFKEIAYIL